MRDMSTQGQGTVILKIKWPRFLNAMWRRLFGSTERAEPPVCVPVRQSCCPFWRPSTRLPDFLMVTAHRSFGRLTDTRARGPSPGAHTPA
jgi:hypothetical protein